MSIPQSAVSERLDHRLDAIARVTGGVTSILDTDLLARRTVDIVGSQFGLSFAGIFMVDDARRWAVLRAATQAQDCRLPLPGDSLVSAAIKTRQAQRALGAAHHIPCLPDSASALALPLIIADEAIGALLVHGEAVAHFDPADTATLHIIADQLGIALNNSRLHRQIQDLLYQSVRRARLLEAANAVGRSVATILDLDELLPKTVDTLCEIYGFYYAGVFLLDHSGAWAMLRAGRGQPGAAMIAAGYRLAVDDASTVGAVIRTRRAKMSLAGDGAIPNNPFLPDTHSEMALPLIVGERVLGAVSVQSTDERAFSPDDVTSLQTMADYLAIAIHNAQTLQELEAANAELLRSKTFEMIATATGEAIHWVGNKAAPIPASVARVREDLARYLALLDALLDAAPSELRENKIGQMLADATQFASRRGYDLAAIQAELDGLPLKRLRRALSVESIFEDLDIVQTGAAAILNIKEDLVGPARQRQPELIHLPELLRDVVAAMGIPSGVVRTLFAEDLPPVRADRRQLDQVFVNLVKNALEAMEAVEDKRLLLWARPSGEPGMVDVEVIDNGAGIPPEQIDKIWVAFYTTKGHRGGTGLGLPACLEIIKQSGGKIRIESQPGEGTTFTVSLPAAK